MRLHHKSVEVFADYHQFYLWDKGMTNQAPEDYSKEDVARRIKTGPYVVVVQPERNMNVPVEIEIHDSEPPYDPAAWDHIAEASLEVATGHLQAHESTGGPVADFKIEKGWYRVRSFHGGFLTIAAVGTDGADFYRVVLWPAAPKDVAVIKQAERAPGS
jgi:hypothetical protein